MASSLDDYIKKLLGQGSTTAPAQDEFKPVSFEGSDWNPFPAPSSSGGTEFGGPVTGMKWPTAGSGFGGPVTETKWPTAGPVQMPAPAPTPHGGPTKAPGFPDDVSDDPRFDPLGGIPRGPDGKKQPYAPYGVNPQGVPYGPSVPIEGADRDNPWPTGTKTFELPFGNPAAPLPTLPTSDGISIRDDPNWDGTMPWANLGLLGVDEGRAVPRDQAPTYVPPPAPFPGYSGNDSGAERGQGQGDPYAPGSGNVPAAQGVDANRLTQLYQELLGRGVDPTGAGTWTGQSEDAVRAGIMQSDEYRNRQGGQQPPQGGDDYSWFQQLTNGKPPTPQTLVSLEGQLAQRGIKVLRNAQGVAGKIQLANGQVIDVIEAAGAGGRAWQWLTGDGGSGGSPNVAGTYGADQEFNDPWAKTLEKLVNDYIAKLTGQPNRGSLDEYVRQLTEQGAKTKQRAEGFAGTLRNRATELNAPVYSGQEEAALRAKAFDQLERRRSETLKNNENSVYARGFEPTSGIIQDAGPTGAREINRDFEQARGGIESEMLLASIAETQRRKDQAVQLEQLATQALEGGDLQSLEFLAQIADIENSRNQDEFTRMMQSIGAAGIPLDLMSQRQQLANQTLGLGGSPGGGLNSILGLLGFNQQQQGINTARRNQTASGVGDIISQILGML